jgi:hypothetical protein
VIKIRTTRYKVFKPILVGGFAGPGGLSPALFIGGIVRGLIRRRRILVLILFTALIVYGTVSRHAPIVTVRTIHGGDNHRIYIRSEGVVVFLH